MPEEKSNNFDLNFETGDAGQPLKKQLDEIRRIFFDFKDNLQLKKGYGQTSFEDILKQAKDLRDEFKKLLNSADIDAQKKLDYENELDEMDDIINKAISKEEDE